MTEARQLPGRIAKDVYVTTHKELEEFGQREYFRGVERGKFENACEASETQGADKLRGELSAALVAHARLQSQNGELTDGLEELRSEYAETRDERDALKDVARRQVASIVRLKTEHAELEGLMEDRRLQVEELRSEIVKLTFARDEARGDRDALQANCERQSAAAASRQEEMLRIIQQRDAARKGHSECVAVMAKMASRFANARIALEGELE